MSYQPTGKIVYVRETKLGTLPTSPEDSPAGPAPKAMNMTEPDGPRCEPQISEGCSVGSRSLTTFKLASPDQAIHTLASCDLASSAGVSPCDTGTCNVGPCAMDACDMGTCDPGTCDMGPSVMGSYNVEGCKLVTCNLDSCNMTNPDVPNCGENGFLPSTVIFVPTVQASAESSNAGGSSMEGPESMEVPVQEPSQMQGTVVLKAWRMEVPMLDPEQLEGLELEPGQLEGFVLEPGQLERLMVHPSQMEGFLLQPSQMEATLLEPWHMEVPMLEPEQLEGLGLEPRQLEGFVLEPGQLQRLMLQPSQMEGFLMQPSQMEATLLEPWHMEVPMLEPEQLEGLELEPRQQEGLMLQAGQQEGLMLQPGQQEGLLLHPEQIEAPVPQYDFPQQEGAKRKIPVKRSEGNGSLVNLTQRFMELLKSAPQGLLDLNDVSARLNVQKRRLYDIINVLDGIGLLAKRVTNTVQWVGPDPSTLGTPKLITQLAELETSERCLDELISDTTESLATIADSSENQQLAYVNFQDIQSVQSLSDEFFIVIKAPAGTQLEVSPSDTNSASICLKSGKGPIEVYFCEMKK